MVVGPAATGVTNCHRWCRVQRFTARFRQPLQRVRVDPTGALPSIPTVGTISALALSMRRNAHQPPSRMSLRYLRREALSGLIPMRNGIRRVQIPQKIPALVPRTCPLWPGGDRRRDMVCCLKRMRVAKTAEIDLRAGRDPGPSVSVRTLRNAIDHRRPRRAGLSAGPSSSPWRICATGRPRRGGSSTGTSRCSARPAC